MSLLRDGVTLYFVRHGETDWNAVGRFQGQTDIPLNEKGRRQAAGNGATLARLLGEQAHTVDYVASPLQRASETMRIARGSMGLAPDIFRREPRLMEQRYGVWEGRLWHELPEIDPAGFRGHTTEPWTWHPEGGESYAMLSERIAGWLETMTHDAVVVAHGAVSRALRGLVVGLAGNEVARLEIPQDRVLVLRRGSMEWI